MASVGRPKNILKTVPMTIALTEPLRERLEALVPSGLYGKSAPEAAVQLISRGIEELQKEGRLLAGFKPKRRRPPVGI